MKTLIIIGMLFLAGCKTSKFQNGTYRVQSAKNLKGKSIVHFEGLKKEFVFDTDTLKKGDLVYFSEMPKGLIKQ
ncbi:MAG: hypothetical protein ABI741_06535 [Ferruginibacter sp.]